MRNDVLPSWRSAFKKGFQQKYIELVIYSYKEIVQMERVEPKPWENTRRNMLLSRMRENKSQFGITFNIASEVGVFDEQYKDSGRIDICCYLNQLEQQYIAFECKRFLKRDIIPSYIREEYYGEGIRRFEENLYADSVNFGGMIAFLEEGDFQKLWQNLLCELSQYSCNNYVGDLSEKYHYQYVLKTHHKRKENSDITLNHILMNFT